MTHTSATIQHTCRYQGSVRHRRLVPTVHTFRYPIHIPYIDLSETSRVFRWPGICSTNRWSLIQFRRSDYHGDPTVPLQDSIAELVHRQVGIHVGRVCLLAQLRVWGIVFNPASFYYCFAKENDQLAAIVVEVTNTPWGERHTYVIPVDAQQAHATHVCEKEFHVSPFMPMDMLYVWRLTLPTAARDQNQLSVHIENQRHGEPAFDATLNIRRQEYSPVSWILMQLLHPVGSIGILLGIYWQALRLWMKGVPFHAHPNKQPA